MQEDNEAVIDAYFTKYDTQIVRWDVATVVAEIEAALRSQRDLYNQARAQMKAERKAERKAKSSEEFKTNVKAKCDKLKPLTSKRLINLNVTETPFKDMYVGFSQLK